MIDPNFDCFNKVLAVGDQCKFYCPVGYQLKGRAVLECLSNGTQIGKWNVDTSKKENVPTCEGKWTLFAYICDYP